ncbi:hypothetical protein B0H19DRAFT_1252957 [Mycena capillaripes]|nr:hypothetical protein B0H19DRAFT_1252957 [Mycena capillaripes]
MYATLYNVSTSSMIRGGGKELHSQITSLYAAHTTQLFEAAPGDDALLVEYCDSEWDKFSRTAAIVNRLFNYVNRDWVALVQWKINMFEPISPRLEKVLGTDATRIPKIRTKFASENLTATDLTAMSPSTFRVVAGVLKLRTKYDIEYLHHRTLLHLLAALPRTLAEYDARILGSPFGARNSELSLLLLVFELSLAWALPMTVYSAWPSPMALTRLPLALQRAQLIARSTLAISQTYSILRFKSRQAHDAFAVIKGVNLLDVMNPTV